MALKIVTQLFVVVALLAGCSSAFEDPLFQEDAQDVPDSGSDTTVDQTDATEESSDAALEAATDAAIEAAADADTCLLPPQTPGDCVEAVCEGDAPILVSDAQDLPVDDGNPCTDDICATGGPYGLLQVAHPNKVTGAPCDEGKTCNGAGACL